MMEFKTDHDFYRWLKSRGWVGNFEKLGEGRTSFTLPDGTLIATVVYDNAALTYEVFPAPFPIDNCPSCLRVYVACPACGRSGRDERIKGEGSPCACGRGILQTAHHRFCCKAAWHHLGTACSHCGMVG